ncbi:hypothetical protein Cni_G29318 [Canna indica]|uniref:Membrane-associated kinase regulator 2 n=1 Tax=Canna indica TaxID=4628 RepID=A0AAQ3L840_9LILI|nr:hypothetical protein Cni_G29318 [Canna indica]
MRLFKLFAHGKRGSAAAVNATTVLLCDSDGGVDSEDDDGPFFDIEFSLPQQENNQQAGAESDGEGARAPEEFDIEMPRRDAALSFSPSDDIHLKGRLVPSSSSDDSSASNMSSKAQAPGFLVESAARIRSFKLSLHRKSKSSALDPAPTAALFARDNCSRSSGSSRSARLFADDGLLPELEERELPGDRLQRYLNKIKPLYVRISKRYGDRLHFSGPLSSSGAGRVRPASEGGDAAGGGHQPKETAPTASSLTGCDENILGARRLRVVHRRLTKSRSASAAVSSVRSPPGRRDDSFLEQQDGIQSAIAHCKQSFNTGASHGGADYFSCGSSGIERTQE